jgi:pilus assembly protein CpaE
LSSAEIFLLLGSLRSHFKHIIVNACGTTDHHLLSLLIGNAGKTVFLLDQSIVSCKQTVALLEKLNSENVPCENPSLLVDRYFPDISPDRGEIESSLGIKVGAAIPAAPETRLRVSNLGNSLFEVAPKDVLAQKIRQMALELLGSHAHGGAAAKAGLFSIFGRKQA